jgi:hypothetical protein
MDRDIGDDSADSEDIADSDDITDSDDIADSDDEAIWPSNSEPHLPRRGFSQPESVIAKVTQSPVNIRDSHFSKSRIAFEEKQSPSEP